VGDHAQWGVGVSMHVPVLPQHTEQPQRRSPTRQIDTHVLPAHVCPHAQGGVQPTVVAMQTPEVQVRPVGHVPVGQVPPQPLGAPQGRPAGHEGRQRQRPPRQVCPVGQVPVQVPPQPSGVPHAAPARHVGVQQA
jgi:hypothetical protein